jgi:DNA polymerase III subunit epsilon
MVDTVALARVKHPGAKLSLDALCTRYGIDRSHRVKHGALLDAELLAHLYIELTGGRQIGLGLVGDIAGEGGFAETRTVAAEISRTYREPRPHAASDEELARHCEFIGKIKEALWLEPESAL